MNILDNVRIGSSDYEVTVSDQVLVVDRCECKGMIDFEFHKIKINNQVHDKQGQEQTFLHELVHGIIKERSLDLQNSNEETIVDEIALGLHQVIIDNSEIFNNKTNALNDKTIRIKDEVENIIEKINK